MVGKKGRLTAARSTVSTTRYTSFDKLGRVKGSSQQTGSTTYSFSYAYNKAGGLETQTYPSGLKIKTCYNAAGRISGVSDNATPAATYASEFGYAAHGALAELKMGNNLYEYRDYNTRLQPQEIGLGTFDGGSDKLKLQFKYGESSNNNGNVLKQIITRPSLTALTQTYTYDKVNRLKTAAESGAGTAWSRSYGYDRYGNRAVTANSGLPTSPLMPTALTNFSTSTNRLTLTGAGYDNSGNLTATSLGDTLAYDAENRLASYTLSSATTTYKYGPQGRRVQKVTPTVTETYVYDAFGKLAAEYSTAAPTSGGTFYRTTDHLGSTRLVTKQDKSDADCYDYAPFGEEIPNTLGNRSSNACFAASFDGRHRFTGKERDDESDSRLLPRPVLLRAHGTLPQRRSGERRGGSGVSTDLERSTPTRSDNPLAYVDPSGAVTVCATEGDSNCTPSEDPEGYRVVVTATAKAPEEPADPIQSSLQRAMLSAITREVGRTAPLANALFHRGNGSGWGTQQRRGSPRWPKSGFQVGVQPERRLQAPNSERSGRQKMLT